MNLPLTQWFRAGRVRIMEITDTKIDKDIDGHEILIYKLSDGSEIHVGMFIGGDDTPVVYVDTPGIQHLDNSINLRVYLNDDTVYEGVPVP